jgi:hypothetical protein
VAQVVSGRLVPNRAARFGLIPGDSQFQKLLGVKELEKSFSGADSEKLKMRRLPPAFCPRKNEF